MPAPPAPSSINRAVPFPAHPSSRWIATGAEIGGTFADESGRYRLAIPAAGGCRLTVSLTGFEPSSAPCTARDARIVLNVAPIAETVIVTATRTEAPAGQVGASVTVFTAEEIERRQKPLVADLLRSSPGAMVVQTGAIGRRHVALRPRR